MTISDNGVIEIDGGDGVGRVTKEGLQIPPGKPAINPVPRRMIAKSVQEVFDSFSFGGGAKVTISVPGGEAVAKRTFNPMLGITGGISIIGTTGIVEPMSEDAIVATTNILIDRRFIEDPEKILITPGNYGSDFCRDHLKLDLKQAVQAKSIFEIKEKLAELSLNLKSSPVDYASDDNGFTNPTFSDEQQA